jgi:hypothetical protein
MRPCVACGKDFRSGRRVVIADGKAPRRALVCMRCAERGVVVVPLVVETKTITKLTAGPTLQAAITQVNAWRKGRTVALAAKDGERSFVDDPMIEAYDQVLRLLETLAGWEG